MSPYSKYTQLANKNQLCYGKLMSVDQALDEMIAPDAPRASQMYGEQALGGSKSKESGQSPAERRDIVRGEKKGKVEISEKAKEQLEERLQDRIKISEKLRDDGEALSDLEKILLRSGQDVIARLKEGNPTVSDLAISWFFLQDELLQKSLAIQAVVKEKYPSPTRRLIWDTRESTTKITQGKLAAESPYLKKEGFAEGARYDEKGARKELKNLNRLRHDVEQAFFGKSFFDPYFYESSTLSDLSKTSLTPFSNTRLVFHEEIASQADVIAKEYGGGYENLVRNSPEKAMEVLYQANQRALVKFASEAARDVLLEDAEGITAERIRQEADRVESKATSPFKTQENFNKANADLETARSQFQNLQSRLETEKQKFAVSRGRATRVEMDLRRYEARTLTLDKLIDGAQADNEIDEEKKQDKIVNLKREQQDAEDKRDQLDLDLQDAKRSEETQRLILEMTQREITQERLKEARETYELMLEKMLEAERELRHSQTESQSGNSNEKKEQMELWAKAKENEGQVLSMVFSRKPQDRLEIEEIYANEGTDKIRELLFGKDNKDQAEVVLTDETIAQAVIQTLNLNPDDFYSQGNYDTEQLLRLLKSSPFETASVLKLLITEGARSAMKGQPVLGLKDYQREAFKVTPAPYKDEKEIGREDKKREREFKKIERHRQRQKKWNKGKRLLKEAAEGIVQRLRRENQSLKYDLEYLRSQALKAEEKDEFRRLGRALVGNKTALQKAFPEPIDIPMTIGSDQLGVYDYKIVIAHGNITIQRGDGKDLSPDYFYNRKEVLKKRGKALDIKTEAAINKEDERFYEAIGEAAKYTSLGIGIRERYGKAEEES